MKAYFTANPDKESAQELVTSAEANTRFLAVKTARTNRLDLGTEALKAARRKTSWFRNAVAQCANRRASQFVPGLCHPEKNSRDPSTSSG